MSWRTRERWTAANAGPCPADSGTRRWASSWSSTGWARAPSATRITPSVGSPPGPSLSRGWDTDHTDPRPRRSMAQCTKWGQRPANQGEPTSRSTWAWAAATLVQRMPRRPIDSASAAYSSDWHRPSAGLISRAEGAARPHAPPSQVGPGAGGPARVPPRPVRQPRVAVDGPGPREADPVLVVHLRRFGHQDQGHRRRCRPSVARPVQPLAGRGLPGPLGVGGGYRVAPGPPQPLGHLVHVALDEPDGVGAAVDPVG